MGQKEQVEIGLGRKVPPFREFVRIYFLQKGLYEEQADYFYLKYELVGWSDGKGNPVRNWKTLASEWIWMMKQN
jgi:hypothetical protein